MADFIGIQENTNQTQSSESNLASVITNLETKMGNITALINETIIPTINTVNSRVFDLDKTPTVVREVYTGSVKYGYPKTITATNVSKCVPVFGTIKFSVYTSNNTIEVRANSSNSSEYVYYAIIEFY